METTTDPPSPYPPRTPSPSVWCWNWERCGGIGVPGWEGGGLGEACKGCEEKEVACGTD